MRSFEDYPESQPQVEQIFTAAYWGVLNEPQPRLTAIDRAIPPTDVPIGKAIRAAKEATIGTMPDILSGQVYGYEVPLGVQYDIRQLPVGTILLYDMESLVPGPMSFRHPYLQNMERESDHYPGKFEYLMALSPREIIRHGSTMDSLSAENGGFCAGGLYYSAEHYDRRLYYWRNCWLVMVAPTGGNQVTLADYLYIPAAQASAAKEPKPKAKLQAISPSLPFMETVGISRKRPYFIDRPEWYGDFRDGVRRVKGLEIISDKYWREALANVPPRKKLGTIILELLAGFNPYPDTQLK